MSIAWYHPRFETNKYEIALTMSLKLDILFIIGLTSVSEETAYCFVLNTILGMSRHFGSIHFHTRQTFQYIAFIFKIVASM